MCNKDSTMAPNAQTQRRMNKPLMERKRRERINKCLNELKTLVLKAQNKDVSRFTKLEKADILEMTLRHVRTTTQEQDTKPDQDEDTHEAARYHSGFHRCVTEVSNYVRGKPGERLVAHLNNILASMNREKLAPKGEGNGCPDRCSGEAVLLRTKVVSSPAGVDTGNGCVVVSRGIAETAEKREAEESKEACFGSSGVLVNRGASPQWFPPSPPLSNDSLQLRLSFHKTESPFSCGAGAVPRLTVWPSNTCHSSSTCPSSVSPHPPSSSPPLSSSFPSPPPPPLPSSSSSSSSSPSPSAPPASHDTPPPRRRTVCQDAPLNLVTNHRRKVTRQKQLQDSAHTLAAPPHPSRLLIRSTLHQVPTGSPISPPSSISSSPEPVPVQGNQAPTPLHSLFGRECRKRRAEPHPYPSQPKRHWRPW